MLEKPGLKDNQIISCLRDEYGLHVEDISFLSLGADVNSSVYRVRTGDGVNYFAKIRKGDSFHEASVVIPNFLSALGIEQVIPSLPTRTRQLWATLNSAKLILYPFVEGQPSLDIRMSKQQWFEFGAALKRFHTAEFPAQITGSIPGDDFSPRWRDMVRMFLAHSEDETFCEPVAMELADVLRSKREEILEIIQWAGQLAERLLEQPPEFMLCHSDIHGYNLFIDQRGALYIVDWDGLTFAPKERDLMFIGGGHGDSGYTPQQEETMFYQGYGQTEINQIALTYYRYERIIMDIAADCDIIFRSDEAEETLKGALEDMTNKFLPDSYIAIAYQSDQKLKDI
jgi:spectinomycin phosphotransferase